MNIEHEIEDWQQRLVQAQADSFEKRQEIIKYLSELKSRLVSKALALEDTTNGPTRKT